MTAEQQTVTNLNDLQGTFVLDASHSSASFLARHAMVTKVRGSFTDFEGTANFDGSAPENSSIEVSLQVASVDTRSADRDAHLKSEDFFNAEKWPAITFKSTEVKVRGDELIVTGDLTIRDQTHAVTIPFDYQGSAVDPFGNTRVGFEGKVVVLRKDWGLTWNAALETGGVLVSDKITLEFDISAIKQA